MSPGEIGFTPREPVPWLNPGLLAGTAGRVVLAHLFGGYLDKRELQAVLPSTIDDHSDAGEIWIDYTADVGDGFDATYTVASLLARPSLTFADADDELPRADVLVLGGDQVYPTASAKAYENRWKGPYRAAFPQPPASGPGPSLYALPGNHDWYDGLTSFLRLFAQGDTIGGWRTRQERSYFALALPHNWWLLAIDVQLSSYIDEPQLDYFRDVATRFEPGDRVILCSAKPGWVQTDDDVEAYDNIDYFVRTILEPTGVRIPLLLAGDMHHYARYAGDGPDGQGRVLITCGGGGAYLVGTNQLPDHITVPPEATTVRGASEHQSYDLRATYPDKARSRRLGAGIFGRLALRNPGFVGLVGLMQTLLMLALTTSSGTWVNGRVAAATCAIVVGTLLFATALNGWNTKNVIAGVLHAVPHIGLGVACASVWSAAPLSDVVNPWNTLLAFAVYLPIVGVLDTWIVCGYLLIARYVNVNVNELYAGMGIDDYKSFVRLHIDRHGTLTIHPIAIDRVGRRWRTDPAASDDAPWIVPAGAQPHARRAEPPITVR